MAEDKQYSESHKLFQERKKQMMSHRKNAHGVELESLMQQADRDYELKPIGMKKGAAWNKGLNLRLPENQVNLKTGDGWQTDNSDAVAFSKVQTALAMLFDRNPGAVLSPGSKRFVADTELAKAIFEQTFYVEKFNYKIKLFVLNLSKYGWAYGRTSILDKTRQIQDLVSVNKVTGEKKYEPKELVTKRVDFRTLNNWNVWVDEKAKPYQKDTINDWFFRETYSDADLISEFGETEEVKKAIAKKSGKVSERVNSDGSATTDSSELERQDLNEVFIYENRDKDLVLVEANGCPIFEERLPVHKDISLVTAMWNLRSDSSIYGVGIMEILRQDKNLLDKIRNMSVDQLILSIYKMFFYDGTLDSEDAGIKIRPGHGQRVLDPSKLKWLEVPSGGSEAYDREQLLRVNMEESTGISKTLSGVASADPNMKALALQQSKDAAIAKLKSPLDNIICALEDEARLRWPLIQELNMSPRDVKKIIDPVKAQEYLDSVQMNEELFHYDSSTAVLYAFDYPEIKAKVKQSEDGVYRPAEEEMFFVVTPERVRWQGDIHFNAESILVSNKELQKQMDLEMSNLLVPLLSGDPAINLKPAKQILKIYGKDEQDWLPEHWLRPGAASQPPTTAQPQEQQAPPGELPTVIPPSDIIPGDGKTNIVDKTMAFNRQPTVG